MKSQKYVYNFEEADGTNKKLFGGKGAGLAEMDFADYMKQPTNDCGGLNIRWDSVAKLTRRSFEFQDDWGTVGNAVSWPINASWYYVRLLNDRTKYIGFLVEKKYCVEIPV